MRNITDDVGTIRCHGLSVNMQSIKMFADIPAHKVQRWICRVLLGNVKFEKLSDDLLLLFAAAENSILVRIPASGLGNTF